METWRPVNNIKSMRLYFWVHALLAEWWSVPNCIYISILQNIDILYLLIIKNKMIIIVGTTKMYEYAYIQKYYYFKIVIKLYICVYYYQIQHVSISASRPICEWTSVFLHHHDSWIDQVNRLLATYHITNIHRQTSTVLNRTVKEYFERELCMFNFLIRNVIS